MITNPIAILSMIVLTDQSLKEHNMYMSQIINIRLMHTHGNMVKV